MSGLEATSPAWGSKVIAIFEPFTNPVAQIFSGSNDPRDLQRSRSSQTLVGERREYEFYERTHRPPPGADHRFRLFLFRHWRFRRLHIRLGMTLLSGNRTSKERLINH